MFGFLETNRFIWSWSVGKISVRNSAGLSPPPDLFKPIVGKKYDAWLAGRPLTVLGPYNTHFQRPQNGPAPRPAPQTSGPASTPVHRPPWRRRASGPHYGLYETAPGPRIGPSQPGTHRPPFGAWTTWSPRSPQWNLVFLLGPASGSNNGRVFGPLTTIGCRHTRIYARGD